MTTEAQRRATLKWQEKSDEIRFRVPKGDKELYTAHAKARGESLTTFLNRAAKAMMEKDSEKDYQNEA